MKFPKETTNPIYTEFFSKSNLGAKVEKTILRNQPSKNSFCFINPEVKYNEREGVVLKKLKEVFGIDSNTFDTKFRQAISGDGQEVKRISTLHSSSLAALLLLYSVSEKKLKCTLDRENYTFNDCFFEVKTNVKDSHFSNMDVVLVGKDSEGINVIFFLESKFSEYLNTGMCNNISIDAYKKSYDELGLIGDNAIKGLLIQEGIGTDNLTCLQIMSTREPQYCSGIKQMISHYIGITNFISRGVDALDPKQIQDFETIVNLRDDAKTKIILGEVLFAFDDKVDKGKTKFSRYSSIYRDLALKLKKKSSRLHILPEVLTYQELLKDFEIDSKVKDFYQL